MSDPATREAMSSEELALDRRARRSVIVTAAALAVAAVVGIALAVGFVSREKARDVLNWQIRLGIVADSRALDVGRWVDARFAVLRDLAQNASLQLYMTNLSLGTRAAKDTEAVEGEYLRNLLNTTAMREGFLAQGQAQVDANVSPTGDSGLALLDERRRPLAATQGMPNLPQEMQDAIRRASEGHPGLMDIVIGANGRPVIGFAVPVYAVQGDPGVSPAVGFVVGLRVVGEDLFTRLKQPGDTAADAETVLVRTAGGQVEYISPLADGTGPLKRRLAMDTPGLASAFVVAHPGGFDQLRDYRGREVLVTGRAVADTPWFVVRKVDRAAALAETDSRLGTMLTVIMTLIVAVLAGAIALWRHGSSVRLSQMAIRHKVTSDLFEGLLQFLRTVTDSQPSQVVCCSADEVITFANRPFATANGIGVTAVKGKKLADVMGPVRAKPIVEVNRRVLATGQKESHVHRFEEDDEVAVITTEHVQIPATARQPAGVLTVISDVTELNRARDRSESRLNQLVAALVGVVDRRDPYSANQSARSAEVAGCVAEEMGLEAQTVSTVRFAAQLMGLGKIVVPKEVLTKTGALTDEERAMLAHSYAVSAEIVDGVAFDGPVAETIRQINERWDGTGPAHLAGDAILLPARIVAVANTFVAMVSPRAYREAMTFENACRILADQTGTAFDRRPVSALVNIIDNRGGPERWAHFREAPKS